MTMAFKVNLFLLNLVQAIILVVSLKVGCVFPPYLPNVMNNSKLGRSNLIKRYCELRLSYKEVLLFLLRFYGIRFNLRHSRDW